MRGGGGDEEVIRQLSKSAYTKTQETQTIIWWREVEILFESHPCLVYILVQHEVCVTESKH